MHILRGLFTKFVLILIFLGFLWSFGKICFFSTILWWNLHFSPNNLSEFACFPWFFENPHFLAILWRHFYFFHDSLTNFTFFSIVKFAGGGSTFWQNSCFFCNPLLKFSFFNHLTKIALPRSVEEIYVFFFSVLWCNSQTSLFVSKFLD